MAFEKKIVVRPANVALVNGELDPSVVQTWTDGLNALSTWSLIAVVATADHLWAFLQREVP